MTHGFSRVGVAAAAATIFATAFCGAPTPSRAVQARPPVYLTFVMHNEQPSPTRPDYLDAGFYFESRDLLRRFVLLAREKGVAFNFQSDWNFLAAVRRYDTPEVAADTNGKNIVRWMAEDMGVEVDPHAHESVFNYADVAYLIRELGVLPSRTVGGFLYYPPDNPQGWEQHEDGVFGWVFGDFFWRADVLWGAATVNHEGPDERSSGVWRPLDADRFTEHSEGRRLVYVGTCTEDYDGLRLLLTDIRRRAAPPEGFYTASIFTAQDFLTEEGLAGYERLFDRIGRLARQGRVEWKTLGEIVDLWRLDPVPSRYECRQPRGR